MEYMRSPMTVRLLALILMPALLLAACSAGGGVTTAPTAPPETGTASRVEVTLTDALKIEPSAMTVPARVPVTFVVTNSGATDHEFYLGDGAAQGEHESEMAELGGMTHDEPQGISVEPGETKELVYTFPEPGETLAGCHVAGHYGGGMKATIIITG